MSTGWMGRALCFGMDDASEVFFPPKPDVMTAEAKKACGACPVREECLDYAIWTQVGGAHITGIWGGMTEDQRGLERRRRQRREREHAA